jgi:hypothetical protein
MGTGSCSIAHLERYVKMGCNRAVLVKLLYNVLTVRLSG